jgi:uncharacterized radical SAM superfamily Fe-S cluster-containing enzyme
MIISETSSVCPVCFKRVHAEYVKRNDAVFFEKECKEHGVFSCLISRSADAFESWNTDTINVKPKEVLSQTKDGCPFDCGPCKEHLQTACCVLIDVTNRCDQSCAVCFASASRTDDFEPSLRDIEKKYDILAHLSEVRKFNIQLSGGEPTVRDDLPKIIEMAKSKGFEYVQLNTNGKRIALDESYAHTLK